MTTKLNKYKKEIKKLVEDNNLTYREIADRFDVSREWIRTYYIEQIEPKGEDNSGRKQGESPW